MFQVIREELETRFGSIGAVAQGTIHFDFEQAAMNAAREVFPEATVQGCLFHWAQAMQQKLDNGKNYRLHETVTKSSVWVCGLFTNGHLHSTHRSLPLFEIGFIT